MFLWLFVTFCPGNCRCCSMKSFIFCGAPPHKWSLWESRISCGVWFLVCSIWALKPANNGWETMARNDERTPMCLDLQNTPMKVDVMDFVFHFQFGHPRLPSHWGSQSQLYRTLKLLNSWLGFLEILSLCQTCCWFHILLSSWVIDYVIRHGDLYYHDHSAWSVVWSMRNNTKVGYNNWFLLPLPHLFERTLSTCILLNYSAQEWEASITSTLHKQVTEVCQLLDVSCLVVLQSRRWFLPCHSLQTS